ncbi:phage holin family protein [Xanthomonas campestris pv. phormiicola]|nr:phage holin family protein [Xanthomonas campestris pv. phormiicola]UYC16785.1 phage holin family protein [Xanthomonas campestris pv. phormiicola]
MSDEQARDAAAPDPAEAEQPSLEQSFREFGQAGREGLTATLQASRALRKLVVADLALARAALARALVWLTIAVSFGASAWMLLMGALIAVLQRLGWSWLASISATAAFSLVVTALGAWQALRYFEMSKLDATRRQLAKLGIGGDDDEKADGHTAAAAEAHR